MARAGTTWMNRCLNRHPDVVCYGETAYWGRLFVAPDADGLYRQPHVERIAGFLLRYRFGPPGPGPGGLRDATLAALPGAVLDALRRHPLPAGPGELFDAAFNRTIAQLEARPAAIEKTPHHLNHLDRILTHLPDARFLVMLREPYGFMLSYKHQGEQRSEAHAAVRRSIAHPLVTALVWRKAMLSAEAALRRAGERCLVVWLHEVEADPAGVFRRACGHFGLRFDPAWVLGQADNSSFADGARRELDAADLFWMNFVCGAIMERHHLARRPTPRDAGAVARSVLRLPGCAWHLLRTIRGRVGGSPLGYALSWVTKH